MVSICKASNKKTYNSRRKANDNGDTSNLNHINKGISNYAVFECRNVLFLLKVYNLYEFI
jgi:hypothetical protein